MILKFTVPGPPQGKARARTVVNPRTGNVHSYTPEKTALYENLVKVCFLEQCGRKMYEKGEPVCASIVAGFPIPKSASKKRSNQMITGTIRPTKKPDADNIAKCILDALNGLAFHDDAQVVEVEVKKIYVSDPGVMVFMRSQ